MINKYLVGILVLVILIRLFLILLPSFRIDMTDWQAWSDRLVNIGPASFYAKDYFSDYFPGYLYILWVLGESFRFFISNIPIFSFEFELYLKFFTNLFDLATGYYIFKIVSNYKKGAGIIASLFYLSNPALIFNSSVWGQVDGILAFFLVFSSYNLLELKKAYRFNISFALATLVKPQGLAVFPVLLTQFLTNFRTTKYPSLLLIPALLTFFSLPFFMKDPILGLFHLFQKSVDTYPYTSMFSYNFWSFAGWWIPDSAKFFNVSYKIWGVFLYFAFLFIILFPLFFKKNVKNNFLIYFACALSIFAFFLFLTRIHQRYLFPFFSFLLITAFVKNALKIKILYFVLSLIHLSNLWFVYYYYNFVYGNPQYGSQFIYKFLNDNYNWFTILNLTGFTFLMLIYYRYSLSAKK